MVGMFVRTLAASSLALVCFALPALAQDTVRVRCTVERIDGPIYVIMTRDGSEVKLTTVADNPLFVAIVPGKMSDIKPGMYVGSAGMMQEDGTQKAIEVHIFPESMRGTGDGHYDWDLLPKSKMTNGSVEQAVTGTVSRGGNGATPNPTDPSATCIQASNIYTETSPFKSLILQGYTASGQDPWPEGGPDPRLAKFGIGCAQNWLIGIWIEILIGIRVQVSLIVSDVLCDAGAQRFCQRGDIVIRRPFHQQRPGFRMHEMIRTGRTDFG